MLVPSGGDVEVFAIETTQNQQTLDTFYNGFGGGRRWGGFGGFGDATTTVDTYKVGTLVVDLFDAKTEKLIWRSSSSDTLSNNADKNTKNLGKGVNKMFQHFLRPVDETLRGRDELPSDVFTRYLNDPEYPGHSSARGKQAARGNGQPEHGGLDQRRLERLHVPGLISIVGRMNEETPKSAPTPEPYEKTQDPEWYAKQAAKLRDELERRQNQLRDYRRRSTMCET